MRSAAARLAVPSLAVVASLSAGCVTGSFSQITINEPVDERRYEALQPGVDDLGSCLHALGAPVVVREYQVEPDGQSGMALVWFWSANVGWGLDVSAPIGRDASASFEFDKASTDLPGCVLWFDRDLSLVRRERGLVGQLLSRPQRPSPRDGD